MTFLPLLQSNVFISLPESTADAAWWQAMRRKRV